MRILPLVLIFLTAFRLPVVAEKPQSVCYTDVVKERRKGAHDMLIALKEAIESQPQADRRNILKLIERTAELAK